MGTTVLDGLKTTGDLEVVGTATMDGAATVGTTLNVTGATTLSSMTVTAAAALNGGITQTGINVTQSMGSNANTQGSGTKLTASQTGALKVYADDGGVALTPSGAVGDLRSILGRALVTADQSAIHARVWGVLGNARVYNALWSEEQMGGLCGRFEAVQADAGTTTLGGYGISAGVTGIAATSGTVTISANHIVAGVAAIADIKGTVTQTGKAVGVLVAPYDTTNWSDGTSRAKFGYGLWIHQDAATRGVHVGALGSNTTSGMPLGGATAINGFYADDSGAAQTASTVWRNMDVRTYFSVTQSNAASDAHVIRAHMKCAAGINFTGDTSVKTGLHAYWELAGDTTVGAGAFGASVLGEMWSDGNFTGTGKAAGVMSRIFFATTKAASGTTAAFMATKQWSSACDWPYGLYIDSATCDIRLANATGAGIYSRATGPNGALTAPKGSLCLVPNGSGANDRLWINTDGGTTWTSITCAA